MHVVPGETYHRHDRGSIRSGPVRTAAAALLLSLGTVLVWIGQRCVTLAQRWAGARTLRSWDAALHSFQADRKYADQAPSWERHLLRLGPSILLSIGGALLVLWTLLGLGGALMWLALHGYGFWLLLGTVALGVLVGGSLALFRRRVPRRDRLN